MSSHGMASAATLSQNLSQHLSFHHSRQERSDSQLARGLRIKRPWMERENPHPIARPLILRKITHHPRDCSLAAPKPGLMRDRHVRSRGGDMNYRLPTLWSRRIQKRLHHVQRRHNISLEVRAVVREGDIFAGDVESVRDEVRQDEDVYGRVGGAEEGGHALVVGDAGLDCFGFDGGVEGVEGGFGFGLGTRAAGDDDDAGYAY